MTCNAVCGWSWLDEIDLGNGYTAPCEPHVGTAYNRGGPLLLKPAGQTPDVPGGGKPPVSRVRTCSWSALASPGHDSNSAPASAAQISQRSSAAGSAGESGSSAPPSTRTMPRAVQITTASAGALPPARARGMVKCNAHSHVCVRTAKAITARVRTIALVLRRRAIFTSFFATSSPHAGIVQAKRLPIPAT